MFQMEVNPLAELIEVSNPLKGLDIRKSLTRDIGFPRPNLSPTGKTTDQSEVIAIAG